MHEEFNYLGATIFWLYILASLVLSGVVIQTIATLPGRESVKQSHQPRDAALFGGLAFISFATLSYNMLNVLIHSFSAWYRQPILAERVELCDIWEWSIESTLFQDFGEAIIASTARQYWTQAALIATMSVCLFMGAEGIPVRRCLSSERIYSLIRLCRTMPTPASTMGFLLPVSNSANQFHAESLLLGSFTASSGQGAGCSATPANLSRVACI